MRMNTKSKHKNTLEWPWHIFKRFVQIMEALFSTMEREDFKMLL